MKSQPKKRKKSRVSGAEKRQAERINRHYTGEEELAGALTRRFVADITNDFDRGTARFDFDPIATAMAGGDPATRGGPSDWPTKAMWQRYAHHFATAETRRKFFSDLDAFARSYLAHIVYNHATAAWKDSPVQPPDLLWDEALLLTRIVPHLLRQWTRDRTRTRRFLTALFRHFERIAAKGSMARRALLTSQAARKLDFKPKALTEFLERTGDLKLQQEHPAHKNWPLALQADTVGRSIRRLRQDDKKRQAAKKERTREARARRRVDLKRARQKRSQ